MSTAAIACLLEGVHLGLQRQLAADPSKASDINFLQSTALMEAAAHELQDLLQIAHTASYVAPAAWEEAYKAAVACDAQEQPGEKLH